MRLDEDAPVDSMGCEKAGAYLPPKVLLLLHTSLFVNPAHAILNIFPSVWLYIRCSFYRINIIEHF